MSFDESSDVFRGRALRVFEYLSDFVRLRTKVIRDISQYKRLFWFDSLPADPDCYTIARGDESEIDPDTWITIKRRRSPEWPVPPRECRDWITPADLHGTDTVPQIKTRIVVRDQQASDSSGGQLFPEQSYLDLTDHPEVRAAWSVYLDTQWKPWAEEQRKWQAVQDCYASLFKIHQEVLRLGEQYELVVGLGYLTWQTESGTIRRHILTAQASLEFDSKNGSFILRPGFEGAKLSLETDMLYPDERPTVEQQKQLVELLLPAIESPWDKSVVFPFMTSWARSLGDRGEFEKTLARPDSATSAPKVTFAPAVILRKRGGQSILAALEKIKNAVQDPGQKIPKEVLRLVCDADEFDGRDRDWVQGEGGKDTKLPELSYLPLPANEEQRRIIDTLRNRSGILVQGPPGTGKSHTIANLICHLLATGNRVLVTAQTPRALKVLDEKIPGEVSPLCVSVLGNDRKALRNLEGSVSEISSRYARWNAGTNQNSIDRLEKELNQKKGRLAGLENDLRSYRERESQVHEVADRSYQGTAQQIASRVATERVRFQWLKDEIKPNEQPPFPPRGFNELLESFRSIDANRLAELEQSVPDPDVLLDVNLFNSLVQEEQRARASLESASEVRNSPRFSILLNSPREAVTEFFDSIKELRLAIQDIKRRPLPWIDSAIRGILTDHDRPWKHLHRVTTESLRNLDEQVEAVDTYSVSKPDTVSDDQLLADAYDLKAHLGAGNRLGWGPFAAKVVRRTRYIPNSVKVQGRRCNDAEHLRMLIEAIEVNRVVDRLWSAWEGKADRVKGSLASQLSELEEQLEALDSVLEIEAKLIHAKERCAAIEGLGGLPWQDATVLDEIIGSLKVLIEEQTLRDIRNGFAKLEDELDKVLGLRDPHVVVSDLKNSVLARDPDSYKKSSEFLSTLAADGAKVRMRMDRHEKLRMVVPLFAKELAQHASDAEWEMQLAQVVDAWNWRRASTWLREYIRAESEEELRREISDVTAEIQECTARLAADRAWRFFFERMTEGQRQHLMAWQQAVKRFGKGTGKHAWKYRRDAQNHLDECRSAIPAWVMPVHRVFETISPEPEMFDVVIVDEASQCGPEALTLLYLAKKVVVVGDDQQISPTAVGVNLDNVDFLQRQHLDGIDHPDSYGATSSFFDHGVIRYGNRIVLREHFRCMPEIIRFSNDLCYAKNPLIPLRQYPPERLKPVVTHYVREGYREGVSAKAHNRPEAELVVRAIQACSKDPNYEGKTMGVISLQGDTQGNVIESMLLDCLDAEEINVPLGDG